MGLRRQADIKGGGLSLRGICWEWKGPWETRPQLWKKCSLQSTVLVDKGQQCCSLTFSCPPAWVKVV